MRERRLFNFQAHFESWKGQLLQTRQLYCGCGQPVVVRHLLDGDFPGNRYFNYTDYEQEISRCPGCGARLSDTALQAAIPADGL